MNLHWDVQEATLRNLYENYQLTTSDLEWEPDYVARDEVHHAAYQTRIKVKNWASFDDPFKLFFQEYVKIQAEKEKVFHDAIRLAERFGQAKRLNPRWIESQKFYLPAVTNAEAEAHRSHMGIARYSQSSALAMASFYQVLDELRHSQNDVHALRYWSKYVDSARNWAVLFQHHWAVQVLRSLFEDMMTPQDPFEALVHTNVALEMGMTNLLFVAAPIAGAANGDTVFAQLQMSTQTDETRHMALGQAALRVILEDGNEENLALLQRWLDKWSWRMFRAFAVTGLLTDYYAENKTSSFKEAYERYYIHGFLEGLMEDFEPLGLKPPRFMKEMESEVDTISHQIFKLAHQYNYINYFRTFPPTEQDKAWLREKYPDWDALVGDYWAKVEAGDPGIVQGLPMVCNLCHFPAVFPTPEKPTLRSSIYQGRTYHFCSDGCKWVFDQEPEKYYKDRTLTELVIAGEAPGDIPALREYMGLPADGSWGGDLFQTDDWKAWSDSHQ
jgi:phenol hydroxylase P3 protein